MQSFIRSLAFYLAFALCSAQSDEDVNWTFTPEEEAELASISPPENATIEFKDFGRRFNSLTDCPSDFPDNATESFQTMLHTPPATFRVKVNNLVVAFSNYGFRRAEEPGWTPEPEGRKFLIYTNLVFNRQVRPCDTQVAIFVISPTFFGTF